MKPEEIEAACNDPDTLEVVLTGKKGVTHIYPCKEEGYKDLFREWLTNGANENPLEYWQKYWRTGIIDEKDLKEQNTFVFGFLEALRQSWGYPEDLWEGIAKIEVRKAKV